MPLRVTVELLDGGSVVAEKPVVTLPGARPLRVELTYEPRTAGRRAFTARVRPTEDLPASARTGPRRRWRSWTARSASC
jgi:hypothetical protein